MSSNRRVSMPVNAVRRSPRRRTKTPSVNELSRKCKISPRGKRRLEFQQAPLKGQTFYLDLQGYRKVHSLQARLKELGGAVEEFLSKDISCVVTINSKDASARCSPRSNSTPSPILSIPSPFPGNTKSSSAKGSAVPSPLSADSGGAEQTGTAAPKHDMRGKALAAQGAITYKGGSSNVIANARNWGVEIMSLEKMLTRLEQYGSIEKKPTSKPLVSGRVAKQGVKPKVRKLRAPFIKVEDHSHAYKPLVHELKEWPKIYFDGPLGSCPFDSPKKDLENDRQEQAKAKRKTAEEDKNKKRGYCECCCVHYEDLDKHLHSDRHQSFARDSSNYQSLDELISKGPSLQDFLAKMLLKHEQKEKEKQEDNRRKSPSCRVTLVDPDGEKTPSKQSRQEIIPNCQTPPNQALEENNGCRTPTNPSPDRNHVCHSPTTDSSPKKKSSDDGTPTRVLRPRGGQADREVDMGESRQLRSSPRLSNSSNKNSSPNKVVDSATSKDVKNKRLNSEKTRDEKSAKRASRAKTHSTSSSPHSKTDIHEKSRETNVQTEGNQGLQMESSKKSSLRSATTLTPPEKCSKSEDCVKSCEYNVQKQSEQDIEMEIPTSTSVRSSTKEKLSELRRGNDNLVKPRKEESKQDIHMESPKRRSLRSAAKETLQGCSGEKRDCFESFGSNVQEELKQDIQMKSPIRNSRRSAVKETLEGCYGENKDCVQSLVPNVQDELMQDIEMKSPIRNGLRSAVKETLLGCYGENKDCVESLVPSVQDEVKQDIQMESPKRACLRSSTRENLSERRSVESAPKTPESPQMKEQNLERKKQTNSSPKTTKQLSDEFNSAKVTNSSETSPGNQQRTIETVQTESVARITRSRAQSSPASTVKLCDNADTTDKTKSMISCSSTQESVEQEHMERRVESLDRPVSCATCESQKNIASSKASALEATKTKNKQDTNQSSGQFSRGSKVVPEVEIKLPDCRQLCVIRKRPLLETESDESETESIQLSSGETLLRQCASENAFSDGKEDDISSTPTLEYCPSPVSSEKSGYSDEAPLARKYSLRKREDQDDHDSCPGKGTRSQSKIPDVYSKTGDRVESRQRTAISSPFTSVKAKRKSSNQRSQSVASPKKKTPEEKTKDSGRKKGTSNNSPRGKALKLKDPISESDSSTSSESPRSGPIQKTRNTRVSTVHSAVRNLQEETAEDKEEEKDSLLLSDSVLSIGDISTTAVRGSPHHLSASLAGIKLLNGSPRIKKDFHSATFLDKHRKERSGVTRLFESDEEEEEEDFIGFNVPHFDRSFSSEGDLSCKINSIVESMDGEASQTTLEDEENITVHEAPSCEEEIGMRENIECEIEMATGKDIIWAGEKGKLGFGEDEEIRQADDTRIGRKRKSSQIENSDVKRSNWSESQSERRSTTVSSSVVDNDDDDDDFDEDDDVFSTVADSSDGEGEEDIVASPFSISSWGRKRKSEDLQPPDVERPTKRRKSQKGTAIDHTCESSQSSRAETPLKRGAGQDMETQKENEKPTSFTSRLDEFREDNQGKRAQSSSSVQDSDSFYDSDVSVYETIEERVKLRRIKNSSKKEHENSQSLPRNQAHRKDDSRELAATGKTEGRLPPLKPLRKRTFEPLKPLKHVSPVRSSSRLSRSNSTPSSNPLPLATPSGRSRRGTWIYDVNEFTSPPSAAPRFGGKPVTCSTPASTIPSSKRILRPLKHDKMAEDSMLRKSRQRDVFAFDE